MSESWQEGAVELGESFMTVNNVLAMTIRKQQVTSGYLPIEYDDGTKELKRISTYRRTFLYNFVKNLPDEEPLVIFAKFRKDLYATSEKWLERLGCGYSGSVRLRGHTGGLESRENPDIGCSVHIWL